MKYIDTDKLITKIKQKIESIENCPFQLASFGEEKKSEGELIAYKDALSLITSLRQEQPKPSGYDKALLEVKSLVDKLYDEASIGLNEYDSGLYNGIAETCMKLRGFIKARLDSDEQPEVDLEKEIYKLYDDEYHDTEDVARHFYELARLKYEK